MAQLLNNESRGFTHFYTFTAADLTTTGYLTSSQREIARIPAGGIVLNAALYEGTAFGGTSADVAFSVGSVSGTATNMIQSTDIDASSGTFILAVNTGTSLVLTTAAYVANAAYTTEPVYLKVAGTLTAAGVASGEWTVGLTILDPSGHVG
jgi:hypothetical protein